MIQCPGKGSVIFFFFFSSRRRHTRFDCDWSSDVCSSDLFDGQQFLDNDPLLDHGLELVVYDVQLVERPSRELLHDVAADVQGMLVGEAVEDADPLLTSSPRAAAGEVPSLAPPHPYPDRAARLPFL